MGFRSTPQRNFFPLNQLLIFTNKFCFDTHFFSQYVEPNFVAHIRDLK